MLSLVVLKKLDTTLPVLLSNVFSLDQFGFFKKGSVQEVCLFVSREVAKRCAKGSMVSVKHSEYMIHVKVTTDGLAVAAVCEQDYPRFTAFAAVKETLELYTKAQGSKWTTATKDRITPTPGLQQLLERYQNPTEVDKVLKIRKELDETKSIVIKNLDQMLERGEKLDTLVQKSNDLSFQSKAFADSAEDLNCSCVIL